MCGHGAGCRRSSLRDRARGCGHAVQAPTSLSTWPRRTARRTWEGDLSICPGDGRGDGVLDEDHGSGEEITFDRQHMNIRLNSHASWPRSKCSEVPQEIENANTSAEGLVLNDGARAA